MTTDPGARAGLKVGASIRSVALSIPVLKRPGGSTILANNIVRTIALRANLVVGVSAQLRWSSAVLT